MPTSHSRSVAKGCLTNAQVNLSGDLTRQSFVGEFLRGPAEAPTNLLHAQVDAFCREVLSNAKLVGGSEYRQPVKLENWIISCDRRSHCHRQRYAKEE
ncbi:hypothetical protein KL86PLE_90684 [uncultured Pleomorphomonas sp.]|uniref:Uncharacterized protein n=1 Tax=uncultured Pleomorphomonas sp. TaxID=442121 RepID=A0A212LQL5_9HYPH|nr:hypothetical protein KL86PLE_90684 [uncultured Pleomorphomonas sp.]